MAEAGRRYGMGRALLICGYADEHRQLETELAQQNQLKQLISPQDSGVEINHQARRYRFSECVESSSIIDRCRLAKVSGYTSTEISPT